MRRLGALALLIVGAGCQPRTEIMLGVATDIKIPGIDEVTLSVLNQGVPVLQQSWPIGQNQIGAFVNLPGSYGVYSPDGSPVRVEVQVGANKNGAALVTRDAIMTLVPGKTLFVRLGLVASCMNRTDCASDQDCVEGTCQAKEIDTSFLPQFSDELVNTLTCSSGVQYINTADNSPMPLSADAANCPSDLCHEGTCYVPPMNQGGDCGGVTCPSGMVCVTVGSGGGTGTGGSSGHTGGTPDGGALVADMSIGPAASPTQICCPVINGVPSCSATVDASVPFRDGGANLTCKLPTDCPSGLQCIAGQCVPGGVVDMSAPLCPGDVMGQGHPIFSSPSPSAIAVDRVRNVVYVADSSTGAVTEMTPCGASPAPIANSSAVDGGTPGPPMGLVVAQGNVFFLAGTNIVGVNPNVPGVVFSVAQHTNNGFLATDTGHLFFTDSTGLYMTTLSTGSPVTPLLSSVTPSSTNKQIAFGGGSEVVFYNGSTIEGTKIGSNTGTPVSSTQISRGLFVDPSGNIYWTDYANGLNEMNQLGGASMSLAAAAAFNGAPGRLATDGTNLLVTSDTGSKDFIARITPAGASAMVVTNATFASSTVAPAVAALPNAVFWIDNAGNIQRAPLP